MASRLKKRALQCAACLLDWQRQQNSLLPQWPNLGSALQIARGKVKSLRTILKELRKDFKGLSTADQTRLAKQLAGEDAISGFLAIMNESDGNWNKLADAVDHAQRCGQENGENGH